MIPVGTIIHQRYQVVRAVGRGGMGTVYEALDQRLQKRVALKEMSPAGQAGFERAFAREAQLLAGLHHPALPAVSDYFVSDQGSFLVMDFIVGADFATLLSDARKPFDLSLAALWADQLLDVVQYLHSQQPPIIHRDIKPQNLKLLPSGQLVLLDFGLAKQQPAVADGRTAGASGTLLAYTQNFAPPEQMAGQPATPLSDIFAVGATLYTLLSGRPPVDAQHRLTQVGVMQQPDPLEPLPQLNPQVPPAVWQVIQRALALEPANRWPAASEMRQAFAGAVTATRGVSGPQPALNYPSGPFPAGPPSAPQPTVRSSMNRPLIIVTVALLGILLVSGGLLARNLTQRDGSVPVGSATAPLGVRTAAATLPAVRTGAAAPPRNTPQDPREQTALAATDSAAASATAAQLAADTTATAAQLAADTAASAAAGSATAVQQTAAAAAATAAAAPTATRVPPTATPVPPSATPLPSDTPLPPSITPLPPSITPSAVPVVTLMPIFTIRPVITMLPVITFGPIVFPTPTPTPFFFVLPTRQIIILP
jgi:eukaryotic-like serine/threonine-protein kinase